METINQISNIFLGAADNILYGLFCAVVIDYITGVCLAIHDRKLSSNIGAKGITRKVAIFAVISIGHVFDAYIFQTEDVIRTIVTTFYFVNECISILENIKRMNLPVPDSLTEALNHIQDTQNSSWQDKNK